MSPRLLLQNQRGCSKSFDDGQFVFRPDFGAAATQSLYTDFTPGVDQLRIEDYLLPSGFTKSMIKVEADGDLYIATSGGHRLVFESLDSSDINALYSSITLI